MSSPLQTDFPITLAGKPFILTYPLSALWAFEDAAGIELFPEVEPVAEDPDESVEDRQQKATDAFNARVFGTVRRERMSRAALLLWAGLHTHHPEITREQAASMLFFHNFISIQATVLQALQYGLAGETSADPQKPAEAGA